MEIINKVTIKHWGLILLMLLALCFILSERALANTTDDSIWVNDYPLEITRDDDPDAALNYNNYVSQNCYDASFKLERYTRKINSVWINKVYSEYSSCAMQTPSGIFYDKNGPAIQLGGSEFAQYLRGPGSGSFQIASIPNSDTFVVKRGGYGGNYPFKFYLMDGLTGGESLIDRFGYRVFQINHFPRELLDENGNNLQIYGTAFSKNGEWMIAYLKNVFMRIHVPSRTMQTFAQSRVAAGLNYRLGVSDDGRYVFEQSSHSWDGGNAFLYDLGGCQPNQSHLISAEFVAGCERRNITNFLRGEIDGFRFLGGVRFSADSQQITATARHLRPTDTFTPSGNSLVTINRAGYVKPDVGYIAMGDSFSSGEGDNDGGEYYEPGTDVEENRCHLSRRSYPYLIAQIFDMNGINKTPDNNGAFHSVACSGATTPNVGGGAGFDTSSSIAKRDNQYVIKPESNGLGDWLPGYTKQVTFAESAGPSFITLSIGGNDVGFADKLVECVTSRSKIPVPTTCKYANNPVDRANVAKEIAAQYHVLKSTYQQLANATHNKSKIYIIAYPQFVNPNPFASCGVNVGLNIQEREFIYESTKYMNQVIRAAAQAAGVYYVDIEGSLTGGTLCSQVADQQMAVNGLTSGDDKRMPTWAGFLVGGVVGAIATRHVGLDNESYHPNATGHQLMKDAILSKLSASPTTFEVCPEQPETFICPVAGTVPLPDEYFGQAAKNYVNWLNKPSVILETDLPPILTPLVVREGSGTDSVRIVMDNLKPDSIVEVVAQSNPVNLGEYRVSGEGKLDIVVTIPDIIAPGFHTIHVFATNLADERRDYYEHVFIPGPPGDINGNGVPDADESCGFVADSGQDYDQDGIDDACDSFISEPAPLANNTESPKPPENNPETVAGDDQGLISPAVQVASATTQHDLNDVVGRQQVLSIVNDGTIQPRVAAATLDTKPLSSKSERPVNKNNATQPNKHTLFMVVSLLLLILPAPVVRLIRRPAD